MRAAWGLTRAAYAVGGDSAGGNLATVVAMRCHEAGGPPLALQVLIYPVTDLSSFDTLSYRESGEGYFLGRAEMEWFASHYLASQALAGHPEVSPLLAPQLGDLPPALVITAEFDPLRDEGEAYAQRLQKAGVPVTLNPLPGNDSWFRLRCADCSKGESLSGSPGGGENFTAINGCASTYVTLRGRLKAIATRADGRKLVCLPRFRQDFPQEAHLFTRGSFRTALRSYEPSYRFFLLASLMACWTSAAFSRPAGVRRDSTSIAFALPVKKGWQLEQISTRRGNDR